MSAVIALLEQIVIASGGAVQSPLTPSNFEARQIQLLEALLVQLAALQTQVNSVSTQAANLQTQVNTVSTAVGAVGTSTNLTYTVSQSSALGGFVGSFANLTDGLTNTGAVTDSVSPPNSWIRFDLGAIRQIDRVSLSGGQLGPYVGLGGALNNSLLQSSFDGSSWSTVLAPSGVTDTGLTNFALSCRARHLRLIRTGTSSAMVAVTGFYLQGY